MKPWLAHYDDDVRRSLEPYPTDTLLDYLERLARHHGSHAALLFKGATITYRQLEDQSNAFAAALVALGVRKGDRVALLLPNCPQFVIAEFGAWKAGAIVVALNPTYSERELQQSLDATRTQTVVTLSLFYERINRVRGRTGVRHVIATSIKEYLPPLLRILFTLFKEKKEGHRVELKPGDHAFPAMLRRHRAPARPDVAVGPDDRAVMSARESLGMDDLPLIKTGYASMVADLLRERGGESRVLQFPA